MLNLAARKYSISMLMTLMIYAPNIVAEELTGVISNYGNPDVRDTFVTKEGLSEATPICRGPHKFVLTQLAGTVVTLTGIRKPIINTKHSCFHVEAFSIKEISPGRKAYVGILKAISKEDLAIIGQNNERWILSQPTPGVRDLEGLTVIADLVAGNATHDKSMWLVSRIFAFPTP